MKKIILVFILLSAFLIQSQERTDLHTNEVKFEKVNQLASPDVNTRLMLWDFSGGNILKYATVSQLQALFGGGGNSGFQNPATEDLNMSEYSIDNVTGLSMVNPSGNNTDIANYVFRTVNGDLTLTSEGGNNGSTVPIIGFTDSDKLLHLPGSNNAAIDAGSLDAATTKRWVQDYVTVNSGTDDQTASEVIYTPYLTITSTELQGAVNELKDELDALDLGGNFDPSANNEITGSWIFSNVINFVGSGQLNMNNRPITGLPNGVNPNDPVTKSQLDNIAPSYGSANRIPFINATDDGFDYSLNLTWDGSNFFVDGNIGVGTETPAEKIDVVGNVKTSGYKITGRTDDDVVLAGGGHIPLNSISGSGLQNVSEDTTPQLGGNLDTGTFGITGTGVIQVSQVRAGNGAGSSLNEDFIEIGEVGSSFNTEIRRHENSTVNYTQKTPVGNGTYGLSVNSTAFDENGNVDIDIPSSELGFIDVGTADYTFLPANVEEGIIHYIETVNDTVVLRLPEVASAHHLIQVKPKTKNQYFKILPTENVDQTQFLGSPNGKPFTFTSKVNGEWIDYNDYFLASAYVAPSTGVNYIVNSDISSTNNIQVSSADWVIDTTNNVVSYGGSASQYVQFELSENVGPGTYTFQFTLTDVTSSRFRLRLFNDGLNSADEIEGYVTRTSNGTFSASITVTDSDNRWVRIDCSSASASFKLGSPSFTLD